MTAKERQDARDRALKELTEFWQKHKKEYVAVRKQEIEYGKKAYKIEKIIKDKARAADLVVDDVTTDGELQVVIDRHVRIIG